MGSRIADSLQRFRHSRGYGVHSPFAYRLVTTVVHPGSLYEYYGYFDIDATLTAASCRSSVAWRMRADARLLLRLAVTLRPRRIFLDTSLHQVYAVALRCADSRIPVLADPDIIEDCDLMVADAEATPRPLLERAISSGCAVVLYDCEPESVLPLFDLVSGGMMLHSPDRAIIIPRPGMARVKYDVNL